MKPRLNALGQPAARWEDLPLWKLPLKALMVFTIFTCAHVGGLVANGEPNGIWKGHI